MPPRYQDPRSSLGRLSRGSNIYNGGNNNATSAAPSPSSSSPSAGPSAPSLPTGTYPSSSPGGWGNPVNVNPWGNPGGAGASPPASSPTGGGSGGSLPGAFQRPQQGSFERPDANGGSIRPGLTPPSTPTPSSPVGPPQQPGLGVPSGGASEGSIGSWIDDLHLTPEQYGLLPGIAPIIPMTTDPGLEAARANAQMLQETLMTNQTAQEERLRAQLEAIMERLGLQRADALDSHEQQMASQGIYRSGINARGQGRIGEQFNQAGSQASQQYGDTVSQIASEVASQVANIMSQLNNAEGDFAIRAQANAQEQAAAQAAAQEARRAAIQAMQTGGTGTVAQNPSGQMQWYSGGSQPSVGGGGSPTPMNVQLPDISSVLQSMSQASLQSPQVQQPQQFLNPALSSAQYGAGPTQLNEALRRRLYGA